MTAETIWSSIAETLRAEIAQGVRAPGARLPTEAQLSKRFGVNRHTVRRALAHLSQEGLLHSRRGVGVFVASRPAEYALGPKVRFHRNISAAGRFPKRHTTLIETRNPTEAEAEALKISTSGRVIATEGISLSDGVPIALFASAFPEDRLPGLADALSELSSVTEALARAGVPDYTRRTTRITAVTADPAQAALLQISAGTALILGVSLSVDPAGRPVEFGTSHFVGERVTLTLDHA
ncbi:phosphonate metabolism transcriptional regulator PhnF [Palleronia abyssalis]|uniref:Putative transcriptional regulator PhnF n=1 Tax=Palleronia abyssalis TaxID=1501240 RepID=A0A2R8BUT6_9RHOB|nr:phosphonate metabolism transcriptional regulator PhnF [Palleronia abyssalis]SPJ23921.1 putative transcriptional regulator PhnF [Palleronia abyssalis]